MHRLVQLLVVGLALLGARMFVRGRRGRVLDDHPVCDRCGFDLTGRTWGIGNCPECGARLDAPLAVRIGNRERQLGLMVGGLAIVAVTAVPMLTTLAISVLQIDTVHIEPVWLLLRDVRDPYSRYAACVEILDRQKRGQLSVANERQVVATALRLQADLSQPWDPRWGDIVEAIHTAGRLPVADWQTYLSHDEVVSLFEVRPKCAIGDPIPFHVRGELRGASASSATSSTMPAVTMVIPGAVVQYPTWGGAFGEMFDLSGNASLTPASAALLHPGTQSMSVTINGIGNAIAASPSQFAPFTCQANWTLLRPGESSVQFYRDETLAAAVMRTLSVEISVMTSVHVTVSSDRPPIAMAFDVTLRSGGREWGSQGGWVLLERNTHDMGGVNIAGSDIIGRRADIVLRPSATGAAHSVGMNRLLDHEFVFKDVLITNTR